MLCIYDRLIIIFNCSNFTVKFKWNVILSLKNIYQWYCWHEYALYISLQLSASRYRVPRSLAGVVCNDRCAAPRISCNVECRFNVTPGLAESLVCRWDTLPRSPMGTSADPVKELRAETRVTLVISSLSLAESGPSDPPSRESTTWNHAR